MVRLAEKALEFPTHNLTVLLKEKQTLLSRTATNRGPLWF
jgi:hypothetical protein